jgi:hypothetical protein
MKKHYPRGKLSADDEGATQMAIYSQDKTVIIRFPEPVAWIGVDGETAIKMAELLVHHARQCGCMKPLEITI